MMIPLEKRLTISGNVTIKQQSQWTLKFQLTSPKL
jgi:hypothetical protein